MTDEKLPQMKAHPFATPSSDTPPLRIADWRRLDVILTRCIQGLPIDSPERAAVFAIRDRFKTSLQRDRKVVLTGVSGSGKSSLLNELMGLNLLPSEQSQNDGDARTYFPIEVVCDPSVPYGGAVIEAKFISLEDYTATHNRHVLCLRAAAAGAAIKKDCERVASDADIAAALAFFADADEVFGPTPREFLRDDDDDDNNSADHVVVQFLRHYHGRRKTVKLDADLCRSFQHKNIEIEFPEKKQLFSLVTMNVAIRGDFRAAIPAGVCVVDCPGCDDSHPTRALNRLECLQNAFAMIAVTNFGSGNRYKMKLAQSVLPEIDVHNRRLRDNCLVVAKNVLPATIHGLDKGLVLAKMKPIDAQSLLLSLLEAESLNARLVDLLHMIQPVSITQHVAHCSNGGTADDDDNDAEHFAVIEKLDIFGSEISGNAAGILMQHKRRELRKIFSFLEQAQKAEQTIFAETCEELVKLCSGFVCTRPPLLQVSKAARAEPEGPHDGAQISRADLQRKLMLHLDSFIEKFPNRQKVAEVLDRTFAPIWHWKSRENFANYGGRNGGASKYNANFHADLATEFIEELLEQWRVWVAAVVPSNEADLRNHLKLSVGGFSSLLNAFQSEFSQGFSCAFREPANLHHPHHDVCLYKSTAVNIVCSRWTTHPNITRALREPIATVIERAVNTANICTVAAPPTPNSEMMTIPNTAPSSQVDAPIGGTLTIDQRRVVQAMKWFFEVGSQCSNLHAGLASRRQRVTLVNSRLASSPAAGVVDTGDRIFPVLPFLHPLEIHQTLRMLQEQKKIFALPGSKLYAPGAHVFANAMQLQLLQDAGSIPVVDSLVIEPALEPMAAAPFEAEEDRSCVICLVADAIVTLLPCLDTPVCADCAPRMLQSNSRCPLCRRQITSTTTTTDQLAYVSSPDAAGNHNVSPPASQNGPADEHGGVRCVGTVQKVSSEASSDRAQQHASYDHHSPAAELGPARDHQEHHLRNGSACLREPIAPEQATRELLHLHDEQHRQTDELQQVQEGSCRVEIRATTTADRDVSETTRLQTESATRHSESTGGIEHGAEAPSSPLSAQIEALRKQLEEEAVARGRFEEKMLAQQLAHAEELKLILAKHSQLIDSIVTNNNNYNNSSGHARSICSQQLLPYPPSGEQGGEGGGGRAAITLPTVLPSCFPPTTIGSGPPHHPTAGPLVGVGGAPISTQASYTPRCSAPQPYCSKPEGLPQSTSATTLAASSASPGQFTRTAPLASGGSDTFTAAAPFGAPAAVPFNPFSQRAPNPSSTPLAHVHGGMVSVVLMKPPVPSCAADSCPSSSGAPTGTVAAPVAFANSAILMPRTTKSSLKKKY